MRCLHRTKHIFSLFLHLSVCIFVISICVCLSLCFSLKLGLAVILHQSVSVFLLLSSRATLWQSYGLSIHWSIGPLSWVGQVEICLLTEFTMRCQTNRFVAFHTIGVDLFLYQFFLEKKKHFCVCGAKVSISEIYQSFSDCHGDLLFTNKVTRLVIDAKRFFTIWE